jgi:uncharacterized LabA/DUF88 family protein
MWQRLAFRRRLPSAKVYIDGANVFYSQKKMGWSVEWAKFLRWARELWYLKEVRYYAAFKPEDEKMISYLNYLQTLGIVVVTKPLKELNIPEDHPLAQEYGYSVIHKANFDVEITADMLLGCAKVRNLVLISGDSDFSYLLSKLKNLGKQTLVIASQQTLSHELKNIASQVIYLEDLKPILEKQQTS